ncbi:MAG: hypothetical protein ACOYK8_04740 [Alphaproteobacteria bacterium]
MNISGFSSLSSAGFDPSKFSQKIQDKFTKDFGSEALAGVQDKDGNIDPSKMKSFMESKGMKPPAGAPPFGQMGGAGGPPSGMGGPDGVSKSAGGDQKILDLFKQSSDEDDDDDSSNKITDSNGKVDYSKLKDFLDKAINSLQSNAKSYSADGAGSGFDLTSFLGKQSSNTSSSSDDLQSQLLQSLFGNNGSKNGLFTDLNA